MSAVEFWGELKEGRVPLPLCPAESEIVYAGYLTWCWRYGRDPDTVSVFVPEFMRAAGLRRFVPSIPDEYGVARRVRVLCLGDRRIEESDERRRVLDGVAEFRRAVQAYGRSPYGEAVEQPCEGAVDA